MKPQVKQATSADEGPSGGLEADNPASEVQVNRDVVGLDVWSYSDEYTQYRESRKTVAKRVLVGASAAVVAGMVLASTNWAKWASLADAIDGGAGWRIFWATLFGIVGSVMLTWATFPYFASRRAFRERKRASAAIGVEVALRGLASSPSGSLPLPELFVLNRRQLDEYQTITKRQQAMAFMLTWAATGLAFVVLVLGIILSYRTEPGTDQYVVAGLTGLGSLITAFLTKTFYDGYDKATKQLSVYYAEPNLTGRALAAERLIDGMEDREARTAAAREVMAVLLMPHKAASDFESREDTNGGDLVVEEQQPQEGR